MKHLGISGGGTKIGGLFGIAESIIYERNYRPDIISGISAGAILAVPLALGKRNEIRDIVLNIGIKSIFNRPPVDQQGKIRKWNAIMQILRGKYYLGTQNNLLKLLAKIVSKREFSDYKEDSEKANCIVGAVDFYTGKRFYINLKKVSYQDFLGFVNASASLPVFTPGVAFQKEIEDFEGIKSTYKKILLFDGGVRDHSPSQKILGSDHEDFRITENATIFSRPDRLEDILDPDEFIPQNILAVLDRHIAISNAEVSKNDDMREQEIMEEKNIFNHGTFYLPRIMQGVYDVDKDRLRELYERSKEIVTDETWRERS